MTASEPARIVFAGTPEFAVPCLERLIGSGSHVQLVLTQPDRPAGRGRRLAASPVKTVALQHDIPVLQPHSLSTPAEIEALPAERPDLLVVVAYGLILPQPVLDWPGKAAINVHASLLPRWRGAAPIQQALLSGDAETGVSIMRMERGLDTGPVYARRQTQIGAGETAGDLHDRLAALGAELLIATVPGILSGDLIPEPQEDALACYAGKIEKADAELDFSRPALELERRVRAFNPWPVAETRTASGERIRIWRAEADTVATSAPAGSVVAAGPTGIDVATGAGILRLTELQPPGGRRMSAAAYLASRPLAGSSLGGSR